MATQNTEISKLFEAIATELREQICAQLSYLGEECVNMQRDHHPNDWTDQSSNLRSSIGFAVYAPEQTPDISDLPAINGAEEGKRKFTAEARKLASQFTKQPTLCVIAGMNYAEYVQDLHNRDVIAGAQLYAEKELPNKMEIAIEDAKHRLNIDD